ncbi:MAG: hypothetical protein ACTSQG_00015 [Promethearchaeota archaeon]
MSYKTCHNKKCISYDELSPYNCRTWKQSCKKRKIKVPKSEILRMAYDSTKKICSRTGIVFSIDNCNFWTFSTLTNTTLFNGMGFESLYNKCVELLK